MHQKDDKFTHGLVNITEAFLASSADDAIDHNARRRPKHRPKRTGQKPHLRSGNREGHSASGSRDGANGATVSAPNVP
nr:hypothetical protein [Dyella sp. ASV24]